MKADRCIDEASLQMFVEGTLQVEATSDVRAHLAECLHCRRVVSEYKQIMWDLDHPAELPIPEELDVVYDRVMVEWEKEMANRRQVLKRTRSIVPALPAWAGYTWSWTRQVPGVSRFGWFMSRTGGAVAKSLVTRWLRFGGGDRR